MLHFAAAHFEHGRVRLDDPQAKGLLFLNEQQAEFQAPGPLGEHEPGDMEVERGLKIVAVIDDHVGDRRVAGEIGRRRLEIADPWRVERVHHRSQPDATVLSDEHSLLRAECDIAPFEIGACALDECFDVGELMFEQRRQPSRAQFVAPVLRLLLLPVEKPFDDGDALAA